jgi:hypothetical protein
VNEYFFYTYCPLSIFKRRKNNRNNVVNGADTFKFLAKLGTLESKTYWLFNLK